MKIIEWIKKRTKKEYKDKYDMLPKNVVFELYNNHKDYNKKLYELEMKLGTFIGRIKNFDDYISENILLHILTKNPKYSNVTGKGSKDIWFNDGKKKMYGEVKCAVNGPTSFSPKKIQDNHHLFYIDASTHLIDDNITVYHIEKFKEACNKLKINKKQSLEDQQKEKRRARCSTQLKKILADNNYSKIIYKGSIIDVLS